MTTSTDKDYFSDYRNQQRPVRNSQLVKSRSPENREKYQSLRYNPDTRNATFISYLPHQQYDCGNGGMTKAQLEATLPDREMTYEEYYQHLDWQNQGTVIDPYHFHKNVNSRWLTHKPNSHMCRAFCSDVELNPVQFGRVYNGFMEFHLGELGQRAEIVLFGVAAVTIHQDKSIREYHPNQREEDRDNTLCELLDKITELPNVTVKTVHKFYRRYEQHLATDCLKDAQRLDYLGYEPVSEDLRPTPVDLRV